MFSSDVNWRMFEQRSVPFPAQVLLNFDEPDVRFIPLRSRSRRAKAFLSVFHQLITELEASVRLAARVVEMGIDINYR